MLAIVISSMPGLFWCSVACSSSLLLVGDRMADEKKLNYCTGTPNCEKTKQLLSELPERTEKQGFPVYVCPTCDLGAYDIGMRQ